MISLSSQIDNQSFIEKTQRERKELLYKFLDISIFENLWKLARDRQREVQFHIKELDESSLQSSISNAELAIETIGIKNVRIDTGKLDSTLLLQTTRSIATALRYIWRDSR
jgi:DNA repair exonuclease SbcCD ATPase subunit